MNPTEPFELRVGLGSCGIANGARPVWEALQAVAVEAGQETAVKAVGCGGGCHREPVVEVIDGGLHAVFTHVTPERAREIARKYLRPRRLATRARWALGRLGAALSGGAGEPAPRTAEVKKLCSPIRQTRIVLENCGEIDPGSLDDYRARDGYRAFEHCLKELKPEQVIAEIAASGLRGRGGAGFPTARKWSLAAGYEAPKYVICNGDEGDPGAFMDRLVLEADPHRVLEGLAIAAWAVGAEEGFFYIRAEYPQAVRHMRQAICQARDAGYLGEGILGTDFRLHFEVREGAGAFVCGEETALIASLEGRRGMPRLRPPYPVESGFRGRPTVINNVETLACVPWILRRGASAFAALGTESSKGTKVFALAGKIQNGGLIEVPMGVTIREIVERQGGGVPGGRSLKAVQLGGPSGGCVPASLADTPVDYEALAKTGAIMGSGGLVVLDDRDCMVDISRFFLSFTREESCGKCTFCRVGTQRMLEILDRLCEGEGRASDLATLEELADRVSRTSLCGLGQTAPNPVLTALKYFRDEFEAHLEGRCPAGSCSALVRYRINDACIGCTLCAQVCPVDAIESQPHQLHEVDEKTCTRCNMCFEACNDAAVEVVTGDEICATSPFVADPEEDTVIILTIDGREITVEPGTSILEAARRLDVQIPTLCHVEGLEPSASCFLCCVQVVGEPRFTPACARPAADGMAVETDTDDVQASRRMALELLLSDHAGDCLAPCAARCPAGLDIPGFVRELAAGSGRQAAATISETLSLPGTLGRVCPRLCEQNCRRCDHDEGPGVRPSLRTTPGAEGLGQNVELKARGSGALAIASLHRYATDRNQTAPRPFEPSRAQPTGKSVGIVGAGPAGLTAAFYLLQKGHACTLYDAHAKPGGMLRYGIPDYRLPAKALDAEIEVIDHLGADFQMNTRWGRDFSLADLRDRHQAVFLGIGAQLSRGLRCEGEDLAISGLDFLERVARGEPPVLGQRAIVLGGGNTAMDAARSAVRQGAGVRVLYRRTRHEMPCLMEEVEGAEEEGVELEYLVAPVGLAATNGHLELTCQRMELGEPDASGRRRPVPIEGSEYSVACDTVIAAVGQSVERELAEGDGVAVTAWGIDADAKTAATNLPGVFAGGDAVLGADLAVRAVAAGRMAAASIEQHLNGEPVTGPPGWTDIAMRPVDEGERAALLRDIEQSARVATDTLDLSERLSGFGEIDHGLSPEQVDLEARRCLSCGCRKADGCGVRSLATEHQVDPYRFAGIRRRFEQDTSHPEIIFEPGKCILCGACVQIAAEAGEEMGLAILGRGFEAAVGTPFGAPLSGLSGEVARRCARACPTAAIALRTARACDLGSQLVTVGRYRERPAPSRG